MKTFLALLLGGLLAVTQSSIAAEVTVSGFAFSGEFANAAQRFPHTYKLFERRKEPGQINGAFSRLVIDKASTVKNASFEYKSKELVSLKNDRALMAVLMMTGETVATEKYGAYYKSFINVRADTLIFDYKNQLIVRSCPVSVVLFDAATQRPTDEQIENFIDDMITRDDAKGMITQAMRCLEKARPPVEGTHTVQVRKAEIAPEAMALFPEPLRNHPEAASAMLTGSLGSVLSSKLGLSMLPDSIGHAVGGVMSMRLENGDDIKLKLGEGDYVFDIKLNKFAKIKTAENNVGAMYVYGAYMSMHLTEPMLATTYIDSDLKNGEAAVVPVGLVNRDDFAAYQDAIQGLFVKFSDAVQQPGSKWLTTAASAKNIESQMASAREILGKCK